jgi:hypothetical protein
MIKGVMITDGGPHPVEKWAEATASCIVDIADHVAGTRRGAAIKLQAAIVDALEKHHTTVQDGERALLVEEGHIRLGDTIDANDHLDIDDTADEIIACAAGTPWEGDFAKPEFKTGLTQLLTQHFHTSMHIERSWHADRNPTAPEAIAFRARQVRSPA